MALCLSVAGATAPAIQDRTSLPLAVVREGMRTPEWVSSGVAGTDLVITLDKYSGGWRLVASPLCPNAPIGDDAIDPLDPEGTP